MRPWLKQLFTRPGSKADLPSSENDIGFYLDSGHVRGYRTLTRSTDKVLPKTLSVRKLTPFVAKSDQLNETPLLTVQFIGDPHIAKRVKV